MSAAPAFGVPDKGQEHKTKKGKEVVGQKRKRADANARISVAFDSSESSDTEDSVDLVLSSSDED